MGDRHARPHPAKCRPSGARSRAGVVAPGLAPGAMNVPPLTGLGGLPKPHRPNQYRILLLFKYSLKPSEVAQIDVAVKLEIEGFAAFRVYAARHARHAGLPG